MDLQQAGRPASLGPSPVSPPTLSRSSAFQGDRQQHRIPHAEVRPKADPEVATLLDRLYGGRLSDRNRSMVALASRRGLSSGTVCEFLGIDKRTHRNYLRAFNNGGLAALFARPTRSTRKFGNEAIKQTVFGLLHEPPSNYGINRTTWTIPELSRILREKSHPACPDVIRRITKTAGYR